MHVGRSCWGRCWPLQNGGRRPGDWGDWAGRLLFGGALCMTPLEGFCFYFDLVLVSFCDFQSFSKDGHIQQSFQPPKVEPMPFVRIPQWTWQTRLLPPQGFLSNFRSWGLREIKEWAGWSQLDQVVWTDLQGPALLWAPCRIRCGPTQIWLFNSSGGYSREPFPLTENPF